MYYVGVDVGGTFTDVEMQERVDASGKVVTAPVFVGDERFCWVANVLHHADVGGSVMGSFCVDATDIFTDPPPFPPFKLVSRRQVQRDLEEIFLRQSRVPVNVHMDLRAAISANRVAAQRITGLVGRYGAGAVKAVMNRRVPAGAHRTGTRHAGLRGLSRRGQPGRHLQLGASDAASFASLNAQGGVVQPPPVITKNYPQA